MNNNQITDILNIGDLCYERFIPVSTLAELSDLHITLAGCSNLSGDYCVGRSAPLEHTLFYTLSGEGKLRTTSGTLPLPAHSMTIVPARQAFEISIVSKQWNIIWLNLANTQRWHQLIDNKPRVELEQKLEPLHAAMELLYSESSAELRKGAIPVVEHYLQVCLPQRYGSTAPVNNRLSKLFQDIDKRLQYDWTVNAMCEHMHVSAPHLHRLCQAQYNTSPKQKLIELRIERAKSLLKHTQWPVQYIASYVGYSNIFAFSKRFKHTTGDSPSVYRAESQLA
jgi:AraC-like DNA-binding protein